MSNKKNGLDSQIGVDDSSDILSEAHWHDTDEVEGEIIDEFYFGEQPKKEEKVVEENKVTINETVSKSEDNTINNTNLYEDVNVVRFDMGNDVELYDVNKTIKLRKSTANMVSDLRIMHPNANVRISRIIDDSIRYYYKFIKDQGGFVVENIELNATRSAGLAKATRDIIYDENYVIPFDEKININGGIEEISGDLIKEYFRASESELYWEVSKFSLEALGKKLGIVQNSKVKNVGLLMFSNYPQKFFPMCQIEVIDFTKKSFEADFTEKIFTGSIYTQLIGALVYISNSVIKEKFIKVNDNSEAVRMFSYPYEAIKEALVNSVYHRDYLGNEPIEVRIYKDEIIIINYPGADKSIRLEDINAGRVFARRYRNRKIGEFLKSMKLAQGKATGLSKIIDVMKKNYSPRPVFEMDDERSYFLVRLAINSYF
ncbi:ATP-binding protein [Clostridium intestinale]|uniref:Predicted transcriptional regulator, contains HTH domain n=1 Tax=Clostridium intestinale DSM 6191 TaxID=1121320 RepID=A0A1M6BAA0_9CLOT|nr:ATP-binding protein [Clostridium intestinale]SHI45616.1 Predicted transcriptional regulator, contains HTH domain [Clostridium intestinale DSM 6191]